MRVGWLSTGCDAAACALLADVVARAQADELPLDIGVVFCSRERGESAESDRLLDLAGRLGLATVTLSSAPARQAAAAAGRYWRAHYHEEVMALLRPFDVDVLVLAGYMLITSPAMCRRYALLNLHPALPGGPTGSWQEVIWQLLGKGTTRTGAMVHLATPQLDRGPVIAYDAFDISAADFAPLWEQLRAKLTTSSLEQIAAAEGEQEPLFAAIRALGETREVPLLYRTLKQFALGQLRTTNGAVFSESARLPLDLTEDVDAELRERGLQIPR
jgi:phosphoribosylglycinamide formyltransferase-1